MLAAAPYRTRATVLTGTTSGTAFGGSAHHDVGAGLTVVADARLHERAALARVLGVPVETGEAALLLAGYARWGAALVHRLAGEFAFVVWDARRREVFAARDALGLRPLYYQLEASGIRFATEVGQLLAALPTRPAVDDEVVLAFLLRAHPPRAQTWFQGIRRVPAGHSLTVAPARPVAVSRWFLPPSRSLRFAAPADADAEFRARFAAAVDKSLAGDAPVVAQLSGGIDSSAVVCMAAALHRERAGRPPLTVATARFPGLACDEGRWSDAVLAHVPFAAVRYDARPTPWSYHHDPAHADRAYDTPLNAGWQRVARAQGAGVVLTGMGGDELLSERGVYRDLAAHGQLAALWRELARAPGYAVRTRGSYVRDVVRSAVLGAVPGRLRAALRAHRRAGDLPGWLAARLARVAADAAEVADVPADAFSSHTQQFNWRWITGTQLMTQLEILEPVAARAGLTVRHPFLDASLVEFVLALPFDQRLPGGLMKRLLRRALADVLPPMIADRREVTTFNDLWRLQAEAVLPLVRSTLHEGSWASAPYVDRTRAQALLERAGATSRDTALPILTLWDITCLELWLRGNG